MAKRRYLPPVVARLLTEAEDTLCHLEIADGYNAEKPSCDECKKYCLQILSLCEEVEILQQKLQTLSVVYIGQLKSLCKKLKI